MNHRTQVRFKLVVVELAVFVFDFLLTSSTSLWHDVKLKIAINAIPVTILIFHNFQI
jgi:hypothetical protein